MGKFPEGEPRVFTPLQFRVSTELLAPPFASICCACLKKRVAESCPSGPCLLVQWMTTRFAKIANQVPGRRGPPSA